MKKTASRQNHTYYRKSYFNDFVQNSFSCNMSILFWPLSSWRLLEANFPNTVTGLANFGFTPLLWCSQGPQGCLEKQNYPLSSNLVVWCAKIGPKTKKVQKTSKMTRKNFKEWWFFITFSKFLGFGPNFSTPNYQIWTQWMILFL